MKATDFRNATFAGLREDLAGMRRAAYEAWVVYGPGTTREVALLSGIDLLTFRPRSTELMQLGLLILDPRLQEVLADGHRPGGQEAGPDPARGHEGIYRTAWEHEWERWKGEMVSGQMQLI